MELERISGWHDILCKLLADGKPFATACAFAQIPAARVYNEMNLNVEFKKRVDRAKAAGRGEGLDEGPGGAIGGARGSSTPTL